MGLEVIKKSTGFESMNKFNIKRVLVVVAPILAHILTLSFSTGVFPKNSKLVHCNGSNIKKQLSVKLDKLSPKMFACRFVQN